MKNILFFTFFTILCSLPSYGQQKALNEGFISITFSYKDEHYQDSLHKKRIQKGEDSIDKQYERRLAHIYKNYSYDEQGAKINEAIILKNKLKENLKERRGDKKISLYFKEKSYYFERPKRENPYGYHIYWHTYVRKNDTSYIYFFDDFGSGFKIVNTKITYDLPNYKMKSIDYSSEDTMTIAGYLCKKVIVTNRDDTQQAYYYTDQIPNLGISTHFGFIDRGFVMYCEEPKCIVQVTEVRAEKVPDSQFDIPEGYKKVTYGSPKDTKDGKKE